VEKAQNRANTVHIMTTQSPSGLFQPLPYTWVHSVTMPHRSRNEQGEIKSKTRAQKMNKVR